MLDGFGLAWCLRKPKPLAQAMALILLNFSSKISKNFHFEIFFVYAYLCLLVLLGYTCGDLGTICLQVYYEKQVLPNIVK